MIYINNLIEIVRFLGLCCAVIVLILFLILLITVLCSIVSGWFDKIKSHEKNKA